MKLNTTTLLLGAAALAVGAVALTSSGGSRSTKYVTANDDCTRITMRNPDAWKKLLEDEIETAVQSADPLRHILDTVMGALEVPGCPSPLPASTVVVNLEGDEVTIEGLRALYTELGESLAAQAGAMSPIPAMKVRRILGVR